MATKSGLHRRRRRPPNPNPVLPQTLPHDRETHRHEDGDQGGKPGGLWHQPGDVGGGVAEEMRQQHECGAVGGREARPDGGAHPGRSEGCGGEGGEEEGRGGAVDRSGG